MMVHYLNEHTKHNRFHQIHKHSSVHLLGLNHQLDPYPKNRVYTGLHNLSTVYMVGLV